MTPHRTAKARNAQLQREAQRAVAEDPLNNEFLKVARDGSLDAVHALLARGPNLAFRRYEDNAAVLAARHNPDRAVFLLLWQSGVPVDVPGAAGYLPIHAFAERGDAPMVAALLDADPELLERSGPSYATPLILSAGHGMENVVALLLARGARASAWSKKGKRALHDCADPAIIRQLVAAGANVNDSTDTAVTPLMCAAERADVEAMKQLLYLGARVNLRGNDKATALLRAAKRNAYACVALLLEAGADRNIPDYQGTTLQLLAERRPDLAAFLAAHAAHAALRGAMGAPHAAAGQGPR